MRKLHTDVQMRITFITVKSKKNRQFKIKTRVTELYKK